jgi:hypothetical protein
MLNRLVIGLSLLSSFALGCDATATPMDAGGDGGALVTTCLGGVTAGEACDFIEPCRTYWDYYMGQCGDETWSCVGGRVVYRDNRFGCSRQDAGPDTGSPSAWCADYAAPPAATSTDCRSSSDCASAGGTCWVPGDTAGLHAGGACPMECDDDSGCSDGNVCVAVNGGSCHLCQAACTEDSCGLWEACGADGHCGPAPCAGGDYVCPPGSTCGGADLDTHGCTIVSCASDAACGCGACVEGACAAGPGRCDLPRP